MFPHMSGSLPAHKFNPLNQFTWSAAYWASDPLWSNPGDGGTVSSWRDGSGNSRDVTPVAGTNTYTVVTSTLNNRPSVAFDGSSYLAKTGFTLTQPHSIVIIAFVATSGSKRTFTDSVTVFNLNRVSLDASDVIELGAGALVTTQTVVENASHLITAYFNSSSSYTTYDGTASSTVDPSTGFTDNGITIGAAYNGAQKYTGNIAFLGYYSGDITTDPKWDTFKAWVKAFYGINVS